MCAGNAAAAICGDADSDGAVTTTDGVRILRVAAALDDVCAPACDVDGDGRVTVTDGVLTLRRAAGLMIVDRCGTGSITGRLLVLPAPALERREREPNDGPGTAEVVGRLAPGVSYRLAGAVASDDPFDGWVFVAATSVAVDFSLTFDDTRGADLDLLIDDRRGGSASCERAAPGAESCRVMLGGQGPHAFDVVVAPAAGSRAAAYALVVAAHPTEAPQGVSPGPGAAATLDFDAAVYRGDAPEIVPGELLLQLTPAGAARGRADRTVMHAALAAVIDAAGIADGLAVEATAPDGTMLLTLPAVVAAAAGGDGGAAGADRKRARAAARARTLETVATFAASPGVSMATPNRVVRPARVPRDPLFGRQWSAEVIALPRAWDVTIGSPAAIVAVVDTGIHSGHPDLAGRVVAGFDFIADPTRANDGDGIDADPFDPGDRPLAPERGTFHGTHVAGTIAATTDNIAGVAGVTWRTGLMPLRALGVGGGTIFDVAQAVRYAAGLPNVADRLPPVRARVINLSLTTTGDDPFLRSAVAAAVDAGALVVAAAGNTGRDGFLSPAGFTNVLSVAATDRLGAPARYSSFGASVDVAAPGGDTRRDRDADGFPDGILSTLAPGDRDYGLMQGTSMASAHVSGVAALLLGVPGGGSATVLRQVLLASANDRGAPGRDDRYGAGLLNAAGAVRMLADLPAPLEPLLVPETTALRVAADESTLAVPLRNAGSGGLVIHAPEVATDDGGPWLGASLEGTNLRITIDRDHLAPGNANGRVRLTSNGGEAEITVVAEVQAEPPGDIGTVLVLLRDASSHGIVATARTDAGQAYRYRFDAVPPGTYVILATTDRNGDGELCDLGEDCGAYPERRAPLAVTVVGGATISARDFGLSLVVSIAEPVP